MPPGELPKDKKRGTGRLPSVRFARAGWLSIERFPNSVIQSVSSLGCLARCRNILPPSSPRNSTAIAALLTSAFHVQDVRWSASPHLHLGPHIVSPRESISAHTFRAQHCIRSIFGGSGRRRRTSRRFSPGPKVRASLFAFGTLRAAAFFHEPFCAITTVDHHRRRSTFRFPRSSTATSALGDEHLYWPGLHCANSCIRSDGITV
jgi:hypothetical protein